MQKRMSRWVAIWGGMAVLMGFGASLALPQDLEPHRQAAISSLLVDDASASIAAAQRSGLAEGVSARHAMLLAQRQAARDGKAVRRHRAVRTRTLSLETAQAVSIPLFDGEVVKARRERFDRHDNRNVWWGRVEGKDHSFVRLTDRSGVLSGAITWAGHTYWLRHAGDGTYALEEIDQAAFLPCGAERSTSDTSSSESVSSASPAAGAEASAAALVSASADDGNTANIDLLAVYTSEAVNAAGGDVAITQRIEDDVDTINAIYSDSGVSIHLNLLAARRIPYAETGDAMRDLDALAAGTGALAAAHDLRDRFGADLVTLFVEDMKVWGGMARCGVGASTGYSVVRRDQFGSWILVHELGHNMGAGHDRDNRGTCALFDYSYGYREPGVLRTIMAYGCDSYCPGCAPCPQIPRFSSPDGLWHDDSTGSDYPFGDPVTDNTRTLNETRTTVAGYRSRDDAPTPPQLYAPWGDVYVNRITHSWSPSVNAVDYTLVVLRRGATFRTEAVPSSNCMATLCQHTPDVVYPDDSYTWIVEATSGSGVTTSSAPASFRVLAGGPDSAEYVADTIPSSMTPGQQYDVSVTMRNTGTSTWSENDLFRLGAVDDSDPFSSSNRVTLPSDVTVPSGQQYTFAFTMTAPASTGAFVTDWQMVHDLVRWFGAVVSKRVVVAYAPPNGSTWPWPPSDGYCFAEAFTYGDGNLNGQAGWSGDAGAEIQVRSRTVQVNGGAGSFSASRSLAVPCGPDANGIITVLANVAKGYGTQNTWNLWIDDPGGNHLVRWYGPPSAARGRVDSPDTATPSWGTLTDTAVWDVLEVRISTRTSEAEFFFNGTSMGTLSLVLPGGDGRVGRVTFERRDNDQATGYLYFDNLAIIGALSWAPIPVPIPTPTPTPAPTPTPTPGPVTAETVVWTSALGVSVSANNLTKTAEYGWGNAGAVSTRSIVSGDGYVEFVITETNTARMIGLSNGNTNASYTDIDFGAYPHSSGVLYVYEAGTSRGTFGSYATGDVIRVAVTSWVVRYSRNGTVFYTSTQTPIYPLLVDTALLHTGATIQDVVISGALAGSPAGPPPTPTPTPTPTPGAVTTEEVLWTATGGVTASGNDLTKTATGGWGNAGAVSTRSISSGDGYVEFVITETNTARMIGLSNGNTDANYTDIDFGAYPHSSGVLYVYEAGTSRGTFGSYATGDVIRVAVTSGVVTYSRNGTVFYTSTQTPVYPLLVDTALYTGGATIQDVVISGVLAGSPAGPPPTPTPTPTPSPTPTPTPTPTPAPVTTEEVIWTATSGVTASGNDLTKTATGGWGNSGAISTRAIQSGDGYVECVATETNSTRMIGLSNGNTDTSYTDVDFGLLPHATGVLYVYEAGTSRGTFGGYATGDVLRVSVAAGVVTYSRNGTVFYTSTQTPTYPLLVDTALYNAGATIQDVVIYGALTGSPAGPAP